MLTACVFAIKDRVPWIAPCIWDPNRTVHPQGENTSSGAGYHSHGVYSSPYASDDQGSWLPSDWNAQQARAVSASPFAVPVPSFMLPENHNTNISLAAYQLMMYLQHPFFLRGVVPPQPTVYAPDDRSVDGYYGRTIVGSGPLYEPEEPSSDGTFKKSS